MHLYLVQHGLAKSKEEDPERGLSGKGIAEVKKMAAFVAEHMSISVTSIRHSGKKRTLQTAELFAKKLKPSGGVGQSENMAPMDDPGVWAELAGGMTEDTMLVGHLPHLSRLASLLVCGDADTDAVRFYNGGVVCLARVETGQWGVKWAVVPGVLK